MLEPKWNISPVGNSEKWSLHFIHCVNTAPANLLRIKATLPAPTHQA